MEAELAPDHTLDVILIEEGYTRFSFTCHHEPPKYPDVAAAWGSWSHGGTDDQCWLMSWWEGLDQELIGVIKPPFVWPLPVRPEGIGEDTSIVKDERFFESAGTTDTQ